MTDSQRPDTPAAVRMLELLILRPGVDIVKIPSDVAIIEKVVKDLLALAGAYGWDESDAFGLHLAVEEAIVNAHRHGHEENLDPGEVLAEKTIHLTWQIDARSARIVIEDEGPGFNPADVPDPTDDEHLELPSGRGLMLMRNFMNEVTFNAKGNQVTMTKRLEMVAAAS